MISRMRKRILESASGFFPALKRPYNKRLVNLVRSVITGKSQTEALMY